MRSASVIRRVEKVRWISENPSNPCQSRSIPDDADLADSRGHMKRLTGSGQWSITLTRTRVDIARERKMVY